MRREIRLTEAALRLLDCASSSEQRAAVTVLSGSGQITAAGARAAGLDSASYGLLTTRIDSELRERGREASLTRDATRLDSLRVRLVVLRTRLAGAVAHGSDARRAGVRPC